MHQIRTQGLGLVVPEQHSMQFHRQATIEAIEVDSESFKKIQHGRMTLPFWWLLGHQYDGSTPRERKTTHVI
jgi:hypothetical protein